jgi:hypothetical protein
MWIESLFFVAQAAGLLMIGGAIWLLFHEKIYIDASTKRVLYVELPFFGKVTTNAPSLALFVLGLAAVLYPPYVARTRYLKVHQYISSTNHPIVVYAVVRQNVQQNDGDVLLSLPILSDPDYDPQLVYVAGPITNAMNIDLSQEKGGVIQLVPESIQDTSHTVPPAVKVDIVPKPDAFK